MSARSRFHIELPPGIVLVGAKFELFVENSEQLEWINIETTNDDDDKIHLKLTTKAATLDPEELNELTKTLRDICSFIDRQKGKK